MLSVVVLQQYSKEKKKLFSQKGTRDNSAKHKGIIKKLSI